MSDFLKMCKKMSAFTDSLQTGAVKFGFQTLSSGIANALAWSNYKKQSALDYEYWLKKTNYSNWLGLQQWNRENEYNSASSQVERLKQAGLAPEIMYSNGTSGGVSADFSPIGASSGTSATFGNANLSPELGLTDITANELNRNNAGLSAARTVTEGTVQALNNARTSLTSEETQLTIQKYLTEVERTSFARLEALIRQGEYKALSKEYDIDVIGSDGKIAKKQIKGFEMDLFSTGIDCMISLFAKAQNDATAVNVIRNINEALSAEHAEYVAMFGSKGIKRLQWDVQKQTLQSILEPFDPKLMRGISKCNSPEDVVKLLGSRKWSHTDIQKLNSIRELLEQLSHTFVGSTTEKYTGIATTVINGVCTVFDAIWRGKTIKDVGKAGKGMNNSINQFHRSPYYQSYFD